MAKNTKTIYQYTYFISYFHENARGTGFGCCTVDCAKRIECTEDITNLRQYLAEVHGFKSVVILNYILMKSPFEEA